jgi:hypothetical protein
MLRTQSASRPRWASSQNAPPSNPSQTGVSRGLPVRRPVVSRRASPGSGTPIRNANLISGFTTDVCSVWMRPCVPLGPGACERCADGSLLERGFLFAERGTVLGLRFVVVGLRFDLLLRVAAAAVAMPPHGRPSTVASR